MHTFCVSLIVLTTLVYRGQCVPTVKVNIDGVGTANVQFIDLNGDNWTFMNYPSDWSQVVGKSCTVEFMDDYINEQKQIKNGTTIHGKIDNVAKDLSIAMTFGSSITITLPMSKTKGFNGYRLINGNIALVIETAREAELLEAFKGCITAYVELGEGLLQFFNKKQVLIQPFPNLQWRFKSNTLLFFKCSEAKEVIQGTTKVGYIDVKKKMLSTTQCLISLSLTSVMKIAAGYANTIDSAGIMWIQSVWNDDGKKSDVNTNDQFDKLKDITRCQLAATNQAQNLDAAPTVSNYNWITVRLNLFYFDSFTKKIMADFDIGQLTNILFIDGASKRKVDGFINEKAKVLTILWNQEEHNKFETCRAEKTTPGTFRALPQSQTEDYYYLTISDINSRGFSIMSKITEQLGKDNILQIPFWQYSYD